MRTVLNNMNQKKSLQHESKSLIWVIEQAVYAQLCVCFCGFSSTVVYSLD